MGYDRDGTGNRVARRGAGGLVTALRRLVSRHDLTWIASAMTDEERTLAGAGTIDETAADGSPFRLRFVAHDPRAYELFYDVVANPVLWFVQHGLWALKHDPDADLMTPWREGYVVVNDAFAAAVAEELEDAPDAVVFFQDYHLYLAPRRVRGLAPDALLAHFVHIPWPPVADWQVLPRAIRRELHEGLLANDVVGFHTERWRRAFLASCDAVLGAGAAGAHGDDRGADLSRRRGVRITRREPDRAGSGTGGRGRSSGAAGAPRRPGRSGKERSARLSRLRTTARASPGSARPCGDVGAPGPLA